MKILEKIDDLIRYVENPEIPFINYAFCFLSAVALRNFLEIFSDTAVVSLRLIDFRNDSFFTASQSLGIAFLHYSLFWMALFLLITLIFSGLTKEKIEKILRVVSAFSLILIITPLFDLLISGGRGINIMYAYPHNGIIYLPFPQELTPGIRVTSSVGMILSFIYCALKSKKISRGALGLILVYLTLLVAAFIPFLIKEASHLAGIKLEAVTPIPIIRMLAIICFFELLAIFYLWKKAYFISLFHDLRLARTAHFLLMFLLGILLFKRQLGQAIFLNPGTFILTVISISFAWITALMINNLADIKLDKISNTSRPTVTGAIPEKTYKKLTGGMLGVALATALCVNATTFFFILAAIGNSIFYSLPPLRLKRVLFFSKIFTCANSLILVMLGWLFAGGEISRFPLAVTLYFLIFLTAATNFIDLKDYAGDKAGSIRTIPVAFGEKKAKIIIGIFIFLSYLVIPWVFLDIWLFWLALPLGALQFFIVNRKDYRESLVLRVYLFSLLGLLLWLKFF